MRCHCRYVLLLVSLIFGFSSVSAQDNGDNKGGTRSDSIIVTPNAIPFPNRLPAGSGGFGDDDQGDPNSGGDTGGTFGDSDQDNPSTDGSSGGGFDDSGMGGVIPLIDGSLLGDANNDGKVTITDAVAIVNYILGNPSDNFNESAADVNNDGKITITDAVSVVNFILNNGETAAPALETPEVVEPE